MDALLQDLRYAFRTLVRSPGFTLVAVLTLALGLGATTSIFSVVNSVLLRPLPFDRPDQLVQVWEAPSPGKRNEVSPGVFLDWKTQSLTFESLAAFTFVDMNLTGTGDPLRVNGLRMSASGLNILRARPLLGRSFLPGDDQPGRDKVVVLTYGLWQRRFGGSMNAIGRTIRLNEDTYTIIGVLPPNFLPWQGPEFVFPYVFEPALANRRDGHWLQLLGRVKPGVTIERAQAELDAISDRSRTLYPAWKKDWGATVVSMHEQVTGAIKPTLLVLLGAVGCVLLIVCANVANLLVAKASARQKEIAVRSALGASRWRVIRQLLAESVLLSLVGGLAGLLLAFWSVDAIRQLSALTLPRAQEVSVDFRVLGVALFVSLLTGVVFGLAPAAQASKLDLHTTLKEGGRGSQGGIRNRLRSGLIVSEVALAMMLLVGMGLLLNSFFRLSRVSPGFDPHQSLTMHLSLPGKKYTDSARRNVFFLQIVERIEALPGVLAAGLVVSLPLASGPPEVFFKIDGRVGGPQPGYLADFEFCTPHYFRAMGIPLIHGRLFHEGDATPGLGVAIINEALAREYFPNNDPLGQSITVDNSRWEIIGIVGDVRQRGLAESVRPLFYRPQSSGSVHWNVRGGNLVVRTSVPPRGMAPSIREAIRGVDPDQPVTNVRTMEDVISASVGQRRFMLMMVGVFAGTALLLAAIGLYGVIAYAVAQRTREIGIRMALGARRSDVLSLVLYHGMRLTAFGILLGVIGALGLRRVLVSLLYEIKPTDPLTLVAVSLSLLLVAAFASWLPARRATRVDPMIALRNE